MAKLRFTDAEVRTLPSSIGSNRIDYATNDVRGFALQTTQTGSKRFLLVYVARGSGRERRLVLGEFGTATRLSVSAARRLAAEKRATVDLGRDPWKERKDCRVAAEAQHATAGATFGALMNAYVDSLRRSKKASAEGVAREIKSTLANPDKKLLNTAVTDVTLEVLVRPLNPLWRPEWRCRVPGRRTRRIDVVDRAGRWP